MSISDLSLSSPRKGGKNRDKSFTYDEDFENFLNEVSSVFRKFLKINSFYSHLIDKTDF